MVNEESIFYCSQISPLFAQTGIEFFITSRAGGFSQSPYKSLNLGYHTQDEDFLVFCNREKIHHTLFPNKTLLWMDQIHSDTILNAHSPSNYQGLIGQADAMICQDNKFACAVMVADCNPILIYEPSIQTFAIIHAGREGVRKKIVSKTINSILQNPQAKVQNLLIFIGPSIRKCCYEIGKEIADLFPKKYLISNAQKYNLDLIGILQEELSSHQIKDSQIEISPICTCCEKNLFSYRREGITGRFALIGALK